MANTTGQGSMPGETGMILVTPENMKPIAITKDWLFQVFFRYIFGDENDARVVVQTPSGLNPGAYNAVLLRREFAMGVEALGALLEQKNAQYGGAWQTDYIITSLVDLKDKLYRLHSASESQAILTWDPDKLRGTLFDVLVRTLMLMALANENGHFLEEDDDRPRLGGNNA